MEYNLENQIEILLNNLISIKNKESLKQIIFTLGNTRVLGPKKYYFTPLRKGNDFILAGIVVFSEEEGRKVLERIDGKVDIIYVDCEKKSKNLYVNSEKEILFNLERLSNDIISKSKLRFYKGNDITIETIDRLVFDLLAFKNRLIGGSNILVVGLGNIGFKISLKLVERGSNVYVLSQNNDKSKSLIEAINLVKPKENLSSSEMFDFNDEELINKLDLIILCHLSTIENYSKIYNKTSKNCIFIDVGKGCLSQKQLKNLCDNGNICFRLDIGDSIVDFISNDVKYAYQKFEFPASKIYNNRKYISRGVAGIYNDIVVDNVLNPKFVYGVCDGNGGFLDLDPKFLKELI
jgi:hypothetical protein